VVLLELQERLLLVLGDQVLDHVEPGAVLRRQLFDGLLLVFLLLAVLLLALLLRLVLGVLRRRALGRLILGRLVWRSGLAPGRVASGLPVGPGLTLARGAAPPLPPPRAGRGARGS